MFPVSGKLQKELEGAVGGGGRRGYNASDAVGIAEVNCAKHHAVLKPFHFRGAEGLFLPDINTLLNWLFLHEQLSMINLMLAL